MAAATISLTLLALVVVAGLVLDIIPLAVGSPTDGNNANSIRLIPAGVTPEVLSKEAVLSNPYILLLQKNKLVIMTNTNITSNNIPLFLTNCASFLIMYI